MNLGGKVLKILINADIRTITFELMEVAGIEPASEEGSRGNLHA